MNSEIEAARELLLATKRNLQLVDEQIANLQKGRIAVSPADDVSSEHRTMWFGVVDDADGESGVNLGHGGVASNFGFGNPHGGVIRMQEDAAFVCTNILVAVGVGQDAGDDTDNTVLQIFENESRSDVLPMLRLTDQNTGRNLINGMTHAPLDRDRGAIPFSYFSSIRHGLGSNVKNNLFAEFTLPRASVVRVEVFNVADFATIEITQTYRAFVTLLGYKVFGA